MLPSNAPRLRFWLLLASLFVQFLALSIRVEAQVHIEQPTPRWHIPAKQGDSGHTRQLLTTPEAGIVTLDRLLAFDRKTGRVLWEHKDEYTSQQQGGITINTGNIWRLVGLVQAEQGRSLAIILTSQYSVSLSSPSDENYQYAYRGLDLQTGKEVWSFPVRMANISKASYFYPAAMWQPLGVYGSVLALCTHRQQGDLQLRNALTGALLDPSNPADQSLIRSSAQQFGAHYDLAADYLERGLVKLDSRADAPISLASVSLAYSGFGEAVGVANGLVVVRIDEDDGSAGHSVWPKYLLCYTVQGKKLWTFPKGRPRMYKMAGDKVIMGTDMEWGYIVPKAGVVVTRDNGYTYGVRLTDGKQLWKRSDMGLEDGIAYGRGSLILASYFQHRGAFYSRLGQLDPQTGVIRWLSQIPLSSRLFLQGDDLFLMGHDGALSVYSFRALLAKSAKNRTK